MPSNIKVLLVDDNPMVLEMLRQALSAFCAVQPVSDGGEALLKAIDERPELIIADYGMTGTDGRELLQEIKGRSATAGIPVILMATKADINEKLKPLQDIVEDFVAKPFFVKEAAARIKKVVDKISLEKMARETPGASVLRGNLPQMNVLDLLQSLHRGRKTCALTLANNGNSCKMFFTGGEINHAVNGPLKGDEAVYKALSWTAGSIEIDFTGASNEHTITQSTEELLAEGLRLLDESNREKEDVLEA